MSHDDHVGRSCYVYDHDAKGCPWCEIDKLEAALHDKLRPCDCCDAAKVYRDLVAKADVTVRELKANLAVERAIHDHAEEDLESLKQRHAAEIERLFVTTHNAMELLNAKLGKAEEHLGRALAWMRDRHEMSCSMGRKARGFCTCGLDAAIADEPPKEES